MMTSLRNASRRGVPIVAVNPLRERALERFAAPQDPIEMATFTSTRIASEYYQVSVSGDVCLFIARAYNIPRGAVAAYFPEANNLMPVAHHDLRSKTPSAKSIPVLVRPMAPPRT